MKQVKFQLKNKLKVILVPSHKSPVVSVQMWVKTGSADEAKNEEGISHFIEHLVFKGTDKFKVGEIASTVEASGGELNAYTSFDQTVFYVTISKNFQDVALDVVSQMMGHPLFDPIETDSEREVVCEEIKMGIDSPGRQSSQLLFSSVFKKHAYGKPVIGYEKNVRSWSVKKIKSFYQSRYVPENMCLVVSGDFESAEMKKKVEAYYSDFKPFKLKKIKRAKEPVQTKPRIISKTKDLKESTYNVAFPSVNVKHKDTPALDVMCMILGQGETSRLFSELRLKSSRVSGISAYSYNPQDAGLIAITFKLMDQNINDAFKGLFYEIEKIKNEEVKWEEIKKAVVNISSEQFYSIETVDGIANKIGSSQFYMNDTYAHEKYLKQIQKITPKQIQKVAQKYFKPEKLNLSSLTPESKDKAEQHLKSAIETWKSVVQELKSLKKKKIVNKKIKIPKIEFKAIKKATPEKLETVVTSNGTRILFKKSKEIPTVTAKILYGGGSRLENPEKMGLVELLSRTWVSSTTKKTEEMILQQIEESAAGINSFAGKNTIGLSIECMKPFENKILDLMTEVTLTPKFDEKIIAREKESMLRQIKAKVDQPSYLCGKQFIQKMFPNHPVAYEQLGTEESVGKISRQDITNYLAKVLKPKNSLVVVVGDCNQSAWVKAIEQIEKNTTHNSDDKKQLVEFAVKKIEKNETLYLEKDKEQSHVIVGWQGISITDPDRYILQIIQAVMAGQGGRLFLELRDKNSLAYSVSPIRMESLETGYFGGYIACSPDKVTKAIDMFHIEFNKIKNTPISRTELERAQRYLIGQHDIGLQRKSSVCNTIAFDDFYGNSIEESLNIAATYQKITQEDVLRVSKKIFDTNYIVSIVGRKMS